jgi:ASC-1-like (ASCH) protein
MHESKRILLLLFLVSIITPYVGTIFFLRTTDLLLLLAIDFMALILLIISTINLAENEADKKMKKWYGVAAVLGVLLYFFSHGLLVSTADYIFFKQRQDQLESLVAQIKEYQKIKEMSDGQRYWKTVNNISIEENIKYVDTTNILGRKYFLNDILAKEGIKIKTYEDFKSSLVSVGLINFMTLEDGTISFTHDGFLDNCHGFAYSTTGINPRINDCGDIILWKKIAKNWYKWETT